MRSIPSNFEPEDLMIFVAVLVPEITGDVVQKELVIATVYMQAARP